MNNMMSDTLTSVDEDVSKSAMHSSALHIQHTVMKITPGTRLLALFGKTGQLLLSIMHEANISIPQLFFLCRLATMDYMTMTDIAKLMGHSTAAATGFIDRLQKLGYVQRLHAQDDRRKVLVQVTRKGHDLVKSCDEELTKAFNDSESSIAEEVTQLQEFVKPLQRKFAAAS